MCYEIETKTIRKRCATGHSACNATPSSHAGLGGGGILPNLGEISVVHRRVLFLESSKIIATNHLAETLQYRPKVMMEIQG
jgi:hypothetical protein